MFNEIIIIENDNDELFVLKNLNSKNENSDSQSAEQDLTEVNLNDLEYEVLNDNQMMNLDLSSLISYLISDYENKIDLKLCLNEEI